MRAFMVLITMADGSQGRFLGYFECGCDAIVETLDDFPDARRIGARRVH